MKLLLLPLSLVLLVGCSGGEPSTASVSPGTTAASSAPAVACPNPGYSPLPDGVVVPAGFHVRSDRLRTTKRGALRRRVVLELLEGDTSSALQQLTGAMTTAGYKAGEVRPGRDGRASIAFSKKGSSRVEANVTPMIGDKPSHPDAKGVLSVEWTVAAAPLAAPATPSDGASGQDDGAPEAPSPPENT